MCQLYHAPLRLENPGQPWFPLIQIVAGTTTWGYPIYHLVVMGDHDLVLKPGVTTGDPHDLRNLDV